MRLTSAPAAGPAYRSITLTVIVTFAASFAFLYWKQRPREAPALVATPPAVSQVEPQRPPPATVAKPVPPPVPTAPPPQAANLDGPALPVLYSVTQRTVRASDDGSPGEMVNVI